MTIFARSLYVVSDPRLRAALLVMALFLVLLAPDVAWAVATKEGM